MEVAVHDGKVYRYLVILQETSLFQSTGNIPDTESIPYILKKYNTYYLEFNYV